MQSRRPFLYLIGLATSAAIVSSTANATPAPIPEPMPLVSLRIGTVLSFPGNPPPGWLLCDGRAISRTYYAELFEVLDTSYGTGDGVTTFNLPTLTQQSIYSGVE